jgi:hypothetical protein
MSSKLPGLRSLAPCPKQLAVYSDPAQDAPDPGQEFPWIEGLGEVVVGADLQPDNPVDGFSGSGEHDDRNATAIPKLARQNEPILPRHFQIENDEADRPDTRHGIQSRAGRRDTFGCADLEFLPAQIFLKQIPHLGFVIDDQNVRLVRHNRSPTTVNFHSPHEGPDCSTVGEAACVSER